MLLTMSSPRLARVRRATAVLAGGLLAATILSAPVGAAVPTPPTPTGLPAAIEPFAQYVPQDSCDPVVKPGTSRLATLLTTTYAGSSWNSAYACGTDGPVSEHYEGRAIDWMVSSRNPAQAAQANAALRWLFAPDKAGQSYAMLRRLGVMYIVYDNRIWGSWNQRWDPYSSCASHPEASYDNSCHRTHMHLSLSWEGAMGRTSYWSKRTAGTDWGPCVAADLNWAAPYTGPRATSCPDHRTVSAPAGASAAMRAVYAYSGAQVSPGSTGPAVTAVQQALGVTGSGYFGTQTASAVTNFQRQQHLAVRPGVVAEMWRPLMHPTTPMPVVAAQAVPSKWLPR